MAINATIYTAFRVFTAHPEVAFIAAALSTFLDTYAAITAIVRTTFFPTISTFPSIVAIAFGLQAHTVTRAIVQAVLSRAGVSGATSRALAVTIVATSSNSTAFQTILSSGASFLTAISAHKWWVAVAFRIFIAYTIVTAVIRASRFTAVKTDKIIGAFALASFIVARAMPITITRASSAGAVWSVVSRFASTNSINTCSMFRTGAVVHARLSLGRFAAIIPTARTLSFIQAIKTFPTFFANALKLVMVAVTILFIESFAIRAAEIL